MPTTLRAILAPAALALVLGGLGSRPARAQAPPKPPVFGARVDIINLSVTVTDGAGRYVTGLKEESFAVFEDGVRQDLTLYTHEDMPISMVIMLDTSASMEEKLPTARAAAINFIKTLRPQDEAQLVQFNDRRTVLQEFTSDHDKLEQAIQSTQASGPTALHNALYVSLKELSRQKREGQLRRRAIVLLSDGEDTASLVSDEQVMDLARHTEINIYSISLRPSRVPERERMSFSQAAHLLTTLSQDTGGQVFFPNSLSELDAVYGRIAEELRSQYNLGYVSNNPRRDGKWRRIVVRVEGRDDVQIRHKLGYFAPAARS